MTAEQIDEDVKLNSEVVEAETTAVAPVPFTGIIATEADANRISKEADDLAREYRVHKDRFDAFVAVARSVWDGRNERRKAFLAKWDIAIESRKDKVEKFFFAEKQRRAEAQAKADAEAKEAARLEALALEDPKTARDIETGKKPVSAPEVFDAPVQIKGMSIKEVKKGRVVDMKAFVAACLKGQGVSLNMLAVEEKKLNDWVKATDGLVPVAGVEFYEEVQSRRTGRRTGMV